MAEWVSEATGLSNKIKGAVRGGMVNERQCYVLNSLADRIRQYAREWNALCGQEAVWKLSGEVGKELVTVLDSCLQLINLCNRRDVFAILGGTGQFREIIDDAMKYSLMINHLISPVVRKKLPAEKQQRLRKLQDRVALDCRSLQADLDSASEEDKEILEDRLKDGLLESNVPASTMLQMMESSANIENDVEFTNEDENLGTGSFGKVQIAVCYQLRVAVKEFINPLCLKEELDVFKELMRHAHVLGKAHVVQMLGYSGEKQLVLELMDGDLKKYILGLNSPPPLIQSVEMILQIAKAMRFLHEVNVVHRDLKPANVLLKKVRSDGNLLLKVTDFGISKDHFKTEKSNTEQRGTFMYMAPEMLDGERYSRKVDIYSFGFVCAEILTGKIREARAEVPTLPNMPKKLKSLIKSCMESDENKRPKTFDYIHDELWKIKEEILMQVSGRLRIPSFRSNRVIYCINGSLLRDSHLSEDYLNEIRLSDVLELKASGQLEILPPVRTRFETLVNLQYQCQGKNMYLEIGGWDHSKHFSTAFSSAETRTTFVTSVSNLLERYPIFNCIVINWMYISDSGINHGKDGNGTSEDDVDNLVLVLQELKEKLPAGVTIALTCTAISEEIWAIEKVIDWVDEIHVVTTHFHGEWDTPCIAAHQSNLLPSSHGSHSVDDAVKMYLELGVPSWKIFIGAALMAVGFANTDGIGKPAKGNSPNHNRPYKQLPMAGSEEMWDDEAKAAYAHDPNHRRIDSYDNHRSMLEKASYVKENNLGGIVVWDGTNDYPFGHERSVMKALHDYEVSDELH